MKMNPINITIAKIEKDHVTWSRKFKTYATTRRFKFNVDFHEKEEIKIEVIISGICEN